MRDFMTSTSTAKASSVGSDRAARIIVVFRNDDPSAASNLEHERENFGLFERYGVPQTLAVVPRVAITDHHDPDGTGERLLSENPEMLEFLRNYAKRTGSEIALHGYTHRANRFSDPRVREYSEFKYLPLDEQQEMIRLGVQILEQAFGVRPVTFVPPWNRWDDNTIAACAHNGCRVISAGPYAAVSNGMISFGSNTNLEDFQRDFSLAKRASRPVFLNVLFHSITLTSAQQELLAQALEMVAQDAECQTTTIAGVAETFADELQSVNEAGRNVVPVYQIPNSMRARAWPHLATLGKLSRFNPIKRFLGMANDLYRAGDYSACRALTPAIEAACARVLLAGRTIAFLAGGMIGALVGWSIQRTGLHPLLLFQCLVPLIFGCGGVVLSRRAISTDTRKEIFLLGLLAAVGVLVVELAAARFLTNGGAA